MPYAGDALGVGWIAERVEQPADLLELGQLCQLGVRADRLVGRDAHRPALDRWRGWDAARPGEFGASPGPAAV